jgi:hypothetical protein
MAGDAFSDLVEEIARWRGRATAARPSGDPPPRLGAFVEVLA